MIKTIVNWKRAHSERMKKVWAQQCNYRVIITLCTHWAKKGNLINPSVNNNKTIVILYLYTV